jgi:cytoskeletal protein RodZ
MSKKTKKKEINVESENHEVESNLENSMPQEIIQEADENLEETTLENTQQFVGDFLREKREEKGLSLKVISQHTKISYTQLDNLEKNNLTVLPDRAYVTGFVKSYCKTIGADQDYAVTLLEKSYGNTPLLEEHENIQEVATQQAQSNSNVSIVLVAIALVIVIAGGLIWKSNQAPEVEVTQEEPIKAQTLTETSPLSSSEVEEINTSEVKEEAVIEATPTEATPKKVENVVVKEEVKETEKEEKKVVEVKTETKPKKEEKKETEKENEIQFRALSLPLYSNNNSMKESEVESLIPSNYRSSLISGKQNVFINATSGDTWITYKSDNDPIKKFILKSGRTLLIRGNTLRVFLGNINVAKVFLNNKPLNIVSRSGVKSLVFPQTEAEKYKLPLFIYKKSGVVITSEEYIAQKQTN